MGYTDTELLEPTQAGETETSVSSYQLWF